MLQHAHRHIIEKISVGKLSTALDTFKWLKVKGIITKVFPNSPIKGTVHTQPEQHNASLSETQKQKGSKNDMQEAQEDKKSLGAVLSCVKNGKTPHCSALQGRSRDTWVLNENFDSLKVVNDIAC